MGIAVTHVPGRLREVSLEDRWREGAEVAFMTGVQAIVRALFDQLRADRAAGRRTGGFVSGYQGSPLGGLDKEIARRRGELSELSIAFQPGVNEELAATSVWGSQLAYLTPGATVDGVLGMWYGKNPGLDRAADAIRHANVGGVGPLGGAVAVVGDDPACKSSTLPNASERTLAGLMVPVLAPSSVQETLAYGRHAFALSRAAGLWAALKVVADVADASATVPLDVALPEVERLVDFAPTAHLLGASSLEPERHLLDVRLPAALAYARRAGLNRVEGARGAARYGVVASGPAYAELRRALHELELDDDALERLGLRVLKLGMPWPLDHEAVRAFADGLETVLVLEDKLAFVETEVAAALLRVARPPVVLGKRDAEDRRLLPAHGALGADDVSRALATLLAAERDALPAIEARLARVERATRGLAEPPIARAPYFCSGCPHNTSTQADADELVGAGIGCHVMLVTQDDERAGNILGLTQMGGEGAQWIGMAPFTERRHLTQNVGDGTFHHSGSLALRAAIAARVNVTYKLLYNDAVAMTGGQHVEGVMPVPELTRLLEAEGVVRTVVTTEDVKRYRGVRLARNASVRPREQLDTVARELAALDGVTVIVHDQQCAAEKRRLRKRGKLPTPNRRVWINERVCEGCGDCGEQSGCLSVVPTATELGRKTQIHQPSCNFDFSCLKGDCPSFLTVATGEAKPHSAPQPPAVPDPAELPTGDATIRMVGIGGTGVLTVAQVLAMAAHLEGRSASGLDQTGLSQKAGPVVSDLRVTVAPQDGSARAAAAEVDVLLAFDVLATTQPGVLKAVDRERTVAVVSDSETPTGPMVTDPALAFPDPAGLVATIARRSARVAATIDAQALSERVFGDAMPANMVLIGAAWQCGLLPLGWDALVRAVELNGAAVETNLAALAWGRAAVAVPHEVERLLWPPAPAAAPPPAWLAERVAAMALPGEAVRELALARASDLVGWGGRAPAERFLDELERVAAVELDRMPESAALSDAFARGFHKLLAYKDEYEVARLHLLPEERARREAELGGGATWVHLHPPALRALGMKRKLRLRRSATPLFTALRALRGLRGTPLDVFGYAEVRRVERALPDEYLAAVEAALERLGAATYDDAVALCASPDVVRGYEEIKLRNVERWRARVAELAAAIAAA